MRVHSVPAIYPPNVSLIAAVGKKFIFSCLIYMRYYSTGMVRGWWARQRSMPDDVT